MDEQRYVVEITRPVPLDKVEQVAQRIATRLNVPHERIVTLLEGRTGEVTKPVLADKADAIAEVFAEAGVRVVVAAARIDPPQYEERFGVPPSGDAPNEPEPPEPDPQEPEAQEPKPPEAESPEPELAEPELPGSEPPEGESPPPWDDAVTWQFGATQDDDFGYAYEPAAPPQEPRGEAAHEHGEEAHGHLHDHLHGDPHLDGDDEGAGHEDGAGHGVGEEHADVEMAAGDYEVDEEEADRLGPVPRMRVEVEPKPQGRAGEGAGAFGSGGQGEYAASTRWTPSPHDPYAFAPEDAAAVDGVRPSPVGPARATPLEPRPERRPPYEPHSVGGFYSPDDENEPRDGPRLRSYLLWALGVSLLVLILLQFVLASRVDGAAGGGSFESGLAAYRLGDFAAARRVWEPLATSGHADAQYLLGFMAQNGLGQPWSNASAANLYRQAAHQGHPRAQLALGDLYMRGMGVDQDLRVGAAWYASAAVAGDAAGQFEYAKLALHGVGVDRDLEAALAWFEAAAANGSAEAADLVEFSRSASR